MMTWFDMKLKFYQWMQIKKKKTKNFVYQYKKQINDILYDHMISQDFSNSIQTLTLHYDLQVYLYKNWFTSANSYFRSIFRSFFFFVYEIIQFWSQPIWQPMIWPLLQLACTRVLWPSVRIDPKHETLFSL